VSIHPGPLVGGVALLTAGLLLPRTDALTRFQNLIMGAWGFRMRIDPDADYAHFNKVTSAVGLCFFGVLLLLWGLGVA
jgi:hypothetical protein